MTPDEREEFLRAFPHYRHQHDPDYGTTVETTDADLEFLRDIEDTVLWETFELDHPLLAAWVEYVNEVNRNLGEEKRLRLASIVRMSYWLALRENVS